jgi:hypothetical protein
VSTRSPIEDGSRTCVDCGLVKSIESFSRHRSFKFLADGELRFYFYHRKICKTCEYAADNRKRRLTKSTRPSVKSLRDMQVDRVKIQRMISGDGAREALTRAERVFIVIRLARAGNSDREVARVAGISDRTVLRIRKRFQIESGWTLTHRHAGVQRKVS